MYCCTTFLLQPTTLEQNVSSLSLPFCQSVFSLFFLRSVWRICGSTFPFDGFDNFYTRCQQSVFSLSLFSFPSLSFPFVNQSTKLVERVVRIIFFHKLLLLLLLYAYSISPVFDPYEKSEQNVEIHGNNNNDVSSVPEYNGRGAFKTKYSVDGDTVAQRKTRTWQIGKWKSRMQCVVHIHFSQQS